MTKNEIENRLSEVRASIAELQDEKNWIQSSLPPHSELYQNFCKLVDKNKNLFEANLHPNNLQEIFVKTGKLTSV